MRILVTGATGQLGYDILRELKERGYNNILGVGHADLDITQEAEVKKFIENYKPDVIMHNAAWTAVDKAELNPVKCYDVNVLGTRYLAEAAQKLNSKFVYISTDYVFDGEGDKPFEINDNKKSLSVYGKTKYQGELEAQKVEKYFIVRVSWVFGINGNNFVKTMLKLSETKTDLNVVCDQIGSPTYTYDLSKLLCTMIETDKYGVYHATNEGFCSWSEFATEIFDVAGKKTIVHPVSTEEYLKTIPQQAKRPLNSRLSKKSLDDAGFERLPTWQDAVTRYIKNELKK
ncbi:MAG: dTDP-4-dehydrorhamnose reductase [Clostridia bacterium]|nr:dTDP-4-dehydrorhamnose reductase [Clostridia bacterium]